ncbi:MAG: hypothetical protein RL268_500 [Pseudomonadota bacterium]|jgi:hypothetical protein
MNAGVTVEALAGEVMCCRRQWCLHWHQRRQAQPHMRIANREERRWWVLCYLRARSMLRTELRMQGVRHA